MIDVDFYMNKKTIWASRINFTHGGIGIRILFPVLQLPIATSKLCLIHSRRCDYPERQCVFHMVAPAQKQGEKKKNKLGLNRSLWIKNKNKKT